MLDVSRPSSVRLATGLRRRRCAARAPSCSRSRGGYSKVTTALIQKIRSGQPGVRENGGSPLDVMRRRSKPLSQSADLNGISEWIVADIDAFFTQ